MPRGVAEDAVGQGRVRLHPRGHLAPLHLQVVLVPDDLRRRLGAVGLAGQGVLLPDADVLRLLQDLNAGRADCGTTTRRMSLKKKKNHVSAQNKLGLVFVGALF